MKYGWNNFIHEILYEGLTQKEACELEIKLISENRTQEKEFGYNINEGGTAPSQTPETRAKLSKALMGNKNSAGRVVSEETRQKIREANLGQKKSEEARKHMSEAAHKRRVPCSEEKKKILSAAYPHKRKIYCKETGVVYESIHECSRQLNVTATNICKVCRGKLSTAGGYHFKYYDSEENA